MRLGEKQEIFAYNYGLLILHAYGLGYQLRLGDVLRSDEQAAQNALDGTGIKDSLHKLKLAGDLNLFRVVNGKKKYLRKSSDHEPLGRFWKSLHPLNRWGGDWEDPDGGHYSITHGGRE